LREEGRKGGREGGIFLVESPSTELGGLEGGREEGRKGGRDGSRKKKRREGGREDIPWLS